MRLRAWLWMSFMMPWLLGLAACGNPHQMDDEIVLQARQASDMADLSLASLMTGTWAVVQFDIQREAMVMPGAYLDETGYHNPPAGSSQGMELQKDVRCQVVEVVRGELSERAWDFTWNDPAYMWRSIYSMRTELPFLRTGSYLAQIEVQKRGRERFVTLLAFPEQWRDFPNPALRTYADYDSVLRRVRDPQPGMMLRFIDDPNPLVQLDAWHTLAIISTPAQLADRLLRARGPQQAAMAVLLAHSLSGDPLAELLAAIRPYLAQTENAEAVLGIAIGAWELLGQSGSAGEFARGLLAAIPPKLDRGLSHAAAVLARVRSLP